MSLNSKNFGVDLPAPSTQYAPPDFAIVMDLMSSIRGVAAIVVATVHAFQIFTLPYFGLYSNAHLATSFLATYAVIAFFIVSGFMIFLSVSRHRDGDGFFNALGFFNARIFRIYPPLVASILISFAVFFIITSFDLHGAQSFRLGDELFFVSRASGFRMGSTGANIVVDL